MNLLPDVKNVYYVDNAIGNDTNTGKSLLEAFKTLAHAKAVATEHDAILVKCGTKRRNKC